MITTLIILAVGLYFIELLFLTIGIEKANRATTNREYEPTVSIIVAARNEELVIRECIESLIKIDYPSEKLDIVIVNDCSTDKTADIIYSYCTSDRRIKMISTNPGKGNLHGKANAISHGIEGSTGEILMFTDADCRVPVSWVKETVKYFDNATGIVGGFTLLDANNWFEGMQSLDWVFLFGLASAMAGWKMPLTVIGNNFSISRLAYEQTGGMQNIPFSVTEDYAIVQAVLSRSEYIVKFPCDRNTLVRSSACRNIRQLYRQKKRWGVGGLDMVTRGFVIMSIGWTAKFILLLTLLFSHYKVWFTAFVVMFVIEILFIAKPLNRLKALGRIKYSIIFYIYFFIYVLILPFIAIFSKNIVWKERQL